MIPERLLALLLLAIPPVPKQSTGGVVSGDLQTWHRVTVTFDGPETSESATPNPFRDYRLDVTFTKGTRSLRVPGFYAADGNAAETSAVSGGKWRVHFSPDEEGTWTYTASFRTGTDVAASTDPLAGTGTSFNGASGSFTVGATDKGGRDHRGKGHLRYVGKHHLQFAKTGEWFLKGGADSPENFLAYQDFDGTPAKHAYAPHAGDWKTGDPVWKSTKGRNIIGALNYLSGKGMNSVYFLTMNVGGDGKDVWPWTSSTERWRYDVSKLDQWEIVFTHMDKLGIVLHVVTQETENDQLLDSGNLGNSRKIYYRELVARFAHHPGLVWNIGEENTNTDAQRKAFADFIRQLDPYDHPIVVHTFPGQYDTVYNPLLGYASYEGPSLQMGSPSDTHAETVKWVRNSAKEGRPWFVCLDEIGPANTGAVPDADDFAHDGIRKQALWGNLMGGGAGVEWYFGYNYAHNDLNCEDWRSRDNLWNLTRIALDFFRLVPFQDMTPNDSLVGSGWCLNKGIEVYAVYLPNGGSTTLTVGAGTYSVRWYDPRAGGSLRTGSVSSLVGPGSLSIGSPPSPTGSDWAALVTLTGGSGGGSGPTVTSFTLVNADSDQDLGPLEDGQSINLATLPTRNLNVRANTSGGTASVRFGLDGNASYRTESSPPFALAGDSAGNYAPWTPSTGSHTITATPYTGSAGTGTAGPPRSVTFTVTDVPGANQPPSASITAPAGGSVFPAGTSITVTASASDPDGTVTSVEFLRNGVPATTDTSSPYSWTWTGATAGTHVFTVRATDDDGASTVSNPVTITVTATGTATVTSFTLINADTDLAIAGFNPFPAGATLDLASLPTRNLNLRANTSPTVVGSVRFGYDGNPSVRIEGASPYALAGDQSGNYFPWTPTVGNHTVTATPFSGSNASGTAGVALTLLFSVVDSGAASHAILKASADPGATGEESGTAEIPDPPAEEASASTGSDSSNCGLLGLETFLALVVLLRRRRAGSGGPRGSR